MNSSLNFPESDSLEGATHPRMAPQLIGHEYAWQTFIKSQLKKKIHHAWILSGPKGIGKATLAWKIVENLVTKNYENQQFNHLKLQKIRQIKTLSLPNLFLCRRPYDDKTKRLKKFITIDEIRKLKSFFQMTAINNEWRICVVDCADDLNKSAANALLKILEEPPQKSIFLIIANQPKRLPATIQSRCRSLTLKKLKSKEVEQVLKVSNFDVENLSSNSRLILSIIADGSAGMAMKTIISEGIRFFQDCLDILITFPNFDRKKIIKLSESFKTNSENFRFVASILLLIIARLALLTTSIKYIIATKEEKELLAKIREKPHLSKKLAELYTDLSKSFLSCYELNLDMPGQLITSFLSIEKVMLENKDE